MPPYLTKKQKIGLVLTLTLSLVPKRNKRKWLKHLHLHKKQMYRMSLKRALDNQDFSRCMRIDVDSFDMLLKLIRPVITKQDTLMKQVVSADRRLLATLKYLVLGKDYNDLALSCGVSVQLMSKIVRETCEAICKVLKGYVREPETQNEWLEVAEQYQEKWQFSNCVGSIGSRHVLVVQPKQGAPWYQNYKGSYSVVLFAIVNADYEFLYVHACTPGGLPEGPILESTEFYEKLDEEELNLPDDSMLPNSESFAPYVFIGDRGFGLDRNILEPYPQENITQSMRIFNYRLFRAARVTENTFGILASRFRVFQKNILVDIHNVEKIIMACCYLHNYLIKTSPNYITSACVDREDVANGTFHEGTWRQNALLPLKKCEEEPKDDHFVKSVFTEYFNGPGKLEFQNKMLNVVPS